MASPRPIAVTQAATVPTANLAAEPVVIVGTLPEAAVPAATTAVRGTVKKVATQADFAGADITALKVELNAWLVKLKTAGIQT